MRKAATDEPAKVYRLHDMIVEEVSLVDRAANRRKFLVVKRDGEESNMALGAAVTQQADGSFTTQPPAGQSASGAPAPAAGATETEVTKAAISLTKDAQAVFQEAIEDAIDGLTDALDTVKKAKIVDPTDGEADPGDLLEQIMAAAEDLSDVCSAYVNAPQPSGDEEEDGNPDQPGATGPAAVAAAASAPPPLPLGKRFQVRRAKRTIAKAEGAQLGKTLLAKYGAKMSKERRARFESALKVLADVFGELAPVIRDKAAKPPAADEKDPKKKTPPMPPGKAPAKKADEAELAAKNAELAKQLGDVQALAKRQAETLAKARATVNPSNVDTEPKPVKKGVEADEKWPLDMNDDRYNRETAGKDFFG